MCGRYVVGDDTERIVEFFAVSEARVPIEASYNVAPRDTVPVIVERSKGRILDAYQWGLVPYWERDLKTARRPINIRVETLRERDSYKATLERRRCLIPTSGFYEWKSAGGRKTPYFFHPQETPAAFAGLCEYWWPAGSGHDEDPLRTCAILTLPPNDIVAPVHDRMPALLTRDAALAWLDPKTAPGEALGLIDASHVALLESWPVGSAVGNVRNNSPDLILRVV
jgi:putative SOS response-associated peptidase YedK